MASEDGEGAEGALLKLVVWGQGFAEDAFVMVEEFGAAVRGASGASAEFFELVEHLALGDIERTGEGGIELAKGFADAREVAAKVAFAEGHLAGQRAGNGFALEFVAEMLASAEDVADGERVFAEQACDVGLDEGETGAGEDSGHESEQAAVDDFGLREVGELCRADDTGGSGQQRILEDGAKQGAGGKIAGRAFGEREEFVEAEGARAGVELGIDGAERDAVAVDFCEKKSGGIRNFNLRMEAGVFEVASAFDEIGDKRGILAQGGGENRCRDSGDCGVMGIEEDEAAAGKQAREQFSAGGRVGVGRGVRSAKGGGNGDGIGAVERGQGRREGALDCWAEGDVADRAANVGRVVRQLDAFQTGATGPVAVVDFGEVVVFAGEPEDGDGVTALGREFGGDADGGECFVERVSGAGEEAGLLAGNNGDGAHGKAVETAGDGGIGAETLVHGAEGGDDGRAGSGSLPCGSGSGL